ncbi:hypothetical protein M5K25_007745 [Dendrobium thyrsiflorum]|uniref:Aminotransferase-like plant mobile domain-containing protein n=1 Tax=Dendrobium thyrsiflorum TaxID=117978 RepID=A0ABD0VF38_DENTH
MYHDPGNADVQSSFTMGSAQVESMLPLRWLRWVFYRDSYDDLPPNIFLQHVRAYILFMIGCFLIPDTSRWEEDRIREIPSGNTMTYIDEFDGLRLSQVRMMPYTEDILELLPERCLLFRELWTARVPMISWKRAEWHLPDRVMRQFGGVQVIDLEPMERVRRIDGRGRADLDWTVKYRAYIEMWNNIQAFLVPVIPPEGNGNQELGRYLRWYRSWASIYLLQPQTLAPETIFPRSPGERLVADYYIRSYELLEPLSGRHGENASSLQMVVDQVVELADRVQRSVYIDYTTFDTNTFEQPHHRPQAPQGSRRSSSNAPSRSTGADEPQRSRRSTSIAPSRMMGETSRARESYEPARQSMYVGSEGFGVASRFAAGFPTFMAPQGSSEAGPSRTYWNPYDVQCGSSYPAYQPETQASYQEPPQTSPMQIPTWMSPFGLPHSSTEQDELLHAPQSAQVTTHLSEQTAASGEAHLDPRISRAPDRYTPGSNAIPKRKKKK